MKKLLTTLTFLLIFTCSFATDKYLEEQLDKELKEINSTLPEKVDEGLVATKIYDNKANIVIEFVFDESEVPAEAFDLYLSNSDKSDLLRDFTSGFDKDDIELLVSLNRGFLIQFVGSDSKHTSEIKFSCNDIKSAFSIR